MLDTKQLHPECTPKKENQGSRFTPKKDFFGPSISFFLWVKFLGTYSKKSQIKQVNSTNNRSHIKSNEPKQQQQKITNPGSTCKNSTYLHVQSPKIQRSSLSFNTLRSRSDRLDLNVSRKLHQIKAIT